MLLSFCKCDGETGTSDPMMTDGDAVLELALLLLLLLLLLSKNREEDSLLLPEVFVAAGVLPMPALVLLLFPSLMAFRCEDLFRATLMPQF